MYLQEWETKYRSQFAAASFELQSPLGTFTLVKDESVSAKHASMPFPLLL